jgi:hypothetical protein
MGAIRRRWYHSSTVVVAAANAWADLRPEIVTTKKQKERVAALLVERQFGFLH